MDADVRAMHAASLRAGDLLVEVARRTARALAPPPATQPAPQPAPAAPSFDTLVHMMCLEVVISMAETFPDIAQRDRLEAAASLAAAFRAHQRHDADTASNAVALPLVSGVCGVLWEVTDWALDTSPTPREEAVAGFLAAFVLQRPDVTDAEDARFTNVAQTWMACAPMRDCLV